jgi:hypothetical protein
VGVQVDKSRYIVGVLHRPVFYMRVEGIQLFLQDKGMGNGIGDMDIVDRVV